MFAEIAPSPCGSYAVVTFKQDVTNEGALEIVNAMQEAAAEWGVSSFLSDVRGHRYLGSDFTHYDFATRELEASGFDRAWKLAVLASEGDSSHDFLEIVCQSAGYQIRLFKDYEEAEAWLMAAR